jgi:serine/threonine-protein kinase
MKICPSCQYTYPTDFALCPRDGAALVESLEWREGDLVRSKYRILGRVGGGGMATVYKALHVAFDELRALKVMLPEVARDATFVRRFNQEAVLTRRLQHPNAVRVEDIDAAEDGRPFIVMEYIEGCSLKDMMRSDSRMSVASVCSIVRQVAAALEAAHRLGIVHRDIKPGNIVLVDGGTGCTPARAGASELPSPWAEQSGPQAPDFSAARNLSHPIAKVLDFGIAKIKEGALQDTRLQGTLTGAGVVVGTPAYMSPEQATGKQGSELDGRSDLYSLGVVMYQMLAGELPLKADSGMGLMIAHIQTAPTDIRTRCPGLSELIADLVMRCLEKDPERRPSSGRAVIETIEHWEQASTRLEAELRGRAAGRARAEVERRVRDEEVRRRSEAERQAREQAERRAREEAEERRRAEAELTARAAEEAAGRARAEVERRVRDEEVRRRSEAEREAHEQAERSAREEAEARRRAEAELGARAAEEAAFRTRAEAERKTEAALRVQFPGAHERQRAEPMPEAKREMTAGGRDRRSKLAPIGLIAVLAASVTVAAYLIHRERQRESLPRQETREAATPPTQGPQANTLQAPPPVAPPPPTTQVVELVGQADAAIQNGDFDAAVKQYQKALDLDPTNQKLPRKIQEAQNRKQLIMLTKRGDDYYQNGEDDNAITQYQKALALDKNNHELPLKIQKARNRKVALLTKTGDNYYQNGEYDNAITQYQKALDLDPTNQELPSRISKAKTAKDTEKQLIN